MRNRLLDNDRLKTASQYVVITLLSLLIVFLILKLWRADFHRPLHYDGDALLHAMFIKGITDNGWYWQNPDIGMPTGLSMYDFPAVDNSAAVVLWVLKFFSADAFVVMNVFYLLTFPLIAISSLFVFKRFGFSFVTSLFGSLLYTFLPYHFMRDESHLFLSAYYSIPLVVLVLLWVMSDEYFTKASGATEVRFKGLDSSLVISLLTCILVGSSGVYYPFFTCFMLIVAGAAGAINRRTLRPLVLATALLLVTSATLIVNLSPSLINIYQNGNAEVTKRNLAGPEIYGLKVAQLLLPVTGHRVPSLNHLKQEYNRYTELTETDAVALGVIGSIGFLVLVGQLFYRRREPELLSNLSILNIFAVLLGTVGGLSSLFALAVSASIRSYNRISVFIAFFALMAVALALERIRARLRTTRARAVFCLVVSLAIGVGILDQTTRGFAPDYPTIKEGFSNDDNFIRTIEAALPSDAMVFQLPYVPFPEHPHVNRMVDYDHFRGYLHSHKLRWSYGTMKNREGDRWQQQVTNLPADDFVRALVFSGFRGIYLDRRGYADDGKASEAELAKALGVTPKVSENGRLAFFDMTPYATKLRSQYSETDWQARQDMALNPILLDWVGGFSGLETSPERTWRWCSSEGELRLKNTSEKARHVEMGMFLVSGHEQSDELVISGPFFDRLDTTSTPIFYSKGLTLPPGETVIKFVSKASPVKAPLDPRTLVFRIENFSLKETD